MLHTLLSTTISLRVDPFVDDFPDHPFTESGDRASSLTDSSNTRQSGGHFADEQVEIIDRSKDDNGSDWCYVKFNDTGAVGWIRSDFVVLVDAPSLESYL